MADVLTHIDTLDVEVAGQEELECLSDIPDELNVSADGCSTIGVWGAIYGDIRRQSDLMALLQDVSGTMQPITDDYIESLQ